ncbi:MAG: hypothetical protein Q8R82_21690 [Hyphomonadaceae bacterium]|nr:hypothetical protein [Hyphomonadaceae bacterium]
MDNPTKGQLYVSLSAAERGDLVGQPELLRKRGIQMGWVGGEFLGNVYHEVLNLTARQAGWQLFKGDAPDYWRKPNFLDRDHNARGAGGASEMRNRLRHAGWSEERQEQQQDA